MGAGGGRAIGGINGDVTGVFGLVGGVVVSIPPRFRRVLLFFFVPFLFDFISIY
tara:strand:- start:60 stop:221 length:162 start_codon:yes stop_codon:yes gene_type:complete